MRGWWVAVLLGTAFAGCTAQGGAEPAAGLDSFEAIEGAGWKAGFHFVHSVTGDIQMRGSFTSGGETERLDESDSFGPEPFMDVTVLSTTVTDGGEPMYVALAEDYFFEESTLLGFRQRDLQPMEVVDVIGGAMLFEPTEEAYPWVQFPLELGDTWSGEFSSSILYGPNITFRVDSTVEGLESVEGPEGPVDAVRIRHEVRVDVTEAVAMLKDDMEASGAEDVEVDFTASATDLVYYAPSLHNIVLDDTQLHLSMRTSFREFGEPSEVELEMDVRGTYRLTEAEFDEAPDLDVAGIVEVIEGDGLPPTRFEGSGGDDETRPPPIEGPDELGTLSVSADTEAPNAATSPQVRFEASPDGDLDPATIVTFLLDAAGSPIAFDDETLEHTFAEPGLFRVQALAFDEDDDLVATGSLDYAVGWMADLPAACDEVVAADLGSCGGWDLPVRPGVSTLTATATPDGSVPLRLAGTLRLVAPSGEERTASLADSVATLTWDAPGLVAAESEGDWHLLYTPEPGILEAVTYSVAMEAGAAGVPGDEESGESVASLARTHAAAWVEAGWAKARLLR